MKLINHYKGMNKDIRTWMAGALSATTILLFFPSTYPTSKGRKTIYRVNVKKPMLLSVISFERYLESSQTFIMMCEVFIPSGQNVPYLAV